MSEQPTARPTSLTTRTIRGVAWTLPTSLGSRVVGLVGTLLLARYLAPAEYGEVTEAAILAVTASGVTTFGVGLYLLSNRDLTRADVFHATCWFVATGVVALGAVWAVTWVILPELRDYMPLFMLSVLLDRISYLPERMLIRQLRFPWLSLARAGGELAFTGTSLGLAVAGYGAMSIVYAFFARSALKFVALVPAVSWREWAEPHRLRKDTLMKIIRFGTTISVAGIATFLMRRWDNLLVQAFFGNATMGAYNYAYNLADTPAVAIGEQMSDVVAASFPHAEGEKRRAAVVRACTMISLIMFPLAFGLGAVAETVVETFFDAKWASVGTMLMLLSVLSAPRPMAHILNSYFLAGQRQRVIMVQEWLSLGILMVGIATIGRLGIHWTCGVVGVAFILRTLMLMWAAERLDGIPMRRFLVPLTRPLVACLAMVAAIEVARPALSGLSPLIRLLAEISIGGAVYLAGALLIFRAAAAEFLGLIRGSLSRRSAD
ncbi:MAG TPA: oligosaccharide flippase family protein [Kofleriaceae bacterium]|nr:oligosaccharide flippase family protein [Kofleriaceae bacterium]